ncbi:41238_t:CDS:2 [Gigaspora margarita]|uniref:41238_t:CDS:1 n=1 Tax=Gigaspora margarita TaxID=4874 RepID=A0ABN7W3L3_GIGMA|nr:41238_t:CDS:2 [Gigaspora margarita]
MPVINTPATKSNTEIDDNRTLKKKLASNTSEVAKQKKSNSQHVSAKDNDQQSKTTRTCKNKKSNWQHQRNCDMKTPSNNDATNYDTIKQRRHQLRHHQTTTIQQRHHRENTIKNDDTTNDGINDNKSDTKNTKNNN